MNDSRCQKIALREQCLKGLGHWLRNLKRRRGLQPLRPKEPISQKEVDRADTVDQEVLTGHCKTGRQTFDIRLNAEGL